MQLSKLENKVYEGLRKNNIMMFKVKDLCLLLNFSRIKAYNIIKSLKKKNIIKKAGKGFFSFNDVNDFVIAQRLSYPSYISFWSALNYYGFSDQTPRKIFIATAKYTKEINNFKYVFLSKKKFFGYKQIGGLVIAEKEKAIIDSLLFPKYSGGIKEISKSILAALNELNIKKLLNYGLKINNKAVLRRMGFILENAKVNKSMLNKIKLHIGKGYELLDPSLKREGYINKKWLLYINC